MYLCFLVVSVFRPHACLHQLFFVFGASLLLVNIIPFSLQLSLCQPANLSELWAREHFTHIPPAALWPGRPDRHHKCNHFITGTSAAAAGERHLRLISPLPQPPLHTEYQTFTLYSHRERWRLRQGQRRKEELFQLEFGGEASESRVAQSGSLGDDRWWRRREPVRHPPKVWYRLIHLLPFSHSL